MNIEHVDSFMCSSAFLGIYVVDLVMRLYIHGKRFFKVAIVAQGSPQRDHTLLYTWALLRRALYIGDPSIWGYPYIGVPI